jgi:hypothetical protein
MAAQRRKSLIGSLRRHPLQPGARATTVTPRYSASACPLLQC